MVDAGVDERHRALERVLADTDGGADDQPSFGVLRGEGVLLALREVLDGDQPAQPAGVVDDRKLLDLVVLQQTQCVVARHADRRGDQRRRGHHVADEPLVVALEADVAVGDDADEARRRRR